MVVVTSAAVGCMVGNFARFCVFSAEERRPFWLDRLLLKFLWIGSIFLPLFISFSVVRFECTDNEIIIKVNLDKPFHGRLYVDGNRASQCNAKFANQRTFTWALPLSAQPCNTVYEGDGLFSNIVTLQYHDTIVTKNDRRYRINCKYDIGLINVTSETLSVLNPETSSLTANPVPPVLSIEITDVNGNGVESALIGETLLFTIAVPKDSPYGISSKNCYAVGEKQGERLQLTDDTGYVNTLNLDWDTWHQCISEQSRGVYEMRLLSARTTAKLQGRLFNGRVGASRGTN